MTEFHIDMPNGETRVYDSFPDACAMAVSVAASGREVNIDVIHDNKHDAMAWGGEPSLDSYMEDPDASVDERITINAESIGRIA